MGSEVFDEQPMRALGMEAIDIQEVRRAFDGIRTIERPGLPTLRVVMPYRRRRGSAWSWPWGASRAIGGLEQVGRLVRHGVLASGSQAIPMAVDEKLERLQRARLARECAKLDPALRAGPGRRGDLEGPGFLARILKGTSGRPTSIPPAVSSRPGASPFERIGRRIDRAAPEEVARVVEGLNEIIRD
jgi:hypothetical protein